ncbi:hypothetical protein DV735_g2278, partial [Chaetothyriales sp. CBS 134920]
MSNFFLPPDSPFPGTLVQIPHILNPRDLLAFHPFTDWLATLSNPRIGFLKLQADIGNAQRESLPGAVFMRGGSVAVLVVITVDDDNGHSQGEGEGEGGNDAEEFTILTVQPRIATGSLAFVELPAGMVDGATGSFAGAAAREIKQETGLDIREHELGVVVLHDALYTSPGASDEFIPIMAVRKTLSREQIERLRGNKTGLQNED